MKYFLAASKAQEVYGALHSCFYPKCKLMRHGIKMLLWIV